MIFGIVLRSRRPDRSQAAVAVVDVRASACNSPRPLSIASAARNDAQKTMGLIAKPDVHLGTHEGIPHPLWIVLSAHTAIALGTLSGGWRIVKTMGQRIVKLKPIDGFCAETASAVSIFTATHMGVPVSTTHVITGAVAGVGAAKNAAAVKWQVTIKIVWAWILTIPMSALCAGLLYEFFGILF